MQLVDNSYKTENTDPLNIHAPEMHHLTDSDLSLDSLTVEPIDEPFTPNPNTDQETEGSAESLPPAPKKNGKMFPLLLLLLAVLAFLYFKNR